MIKLIDENKDTEDAKMMTLCEDIFNFKDLHDTYTAIRSTSISINSLPKDKLKIQIAPDPEEIQRSANGDVHSYLKTKLQLEVIQRSRFINILDD
jgi:hypothetical protein